MWGGAGWVTVIVGTVNKLTLRQQGTKQQGVKMDTTMHMQERDDWQHRAILRRSPQRSWHTAMPSGAVACVM